jgi:hypothetical protein
MAFFSRKGTTAAATRTIRMALFYLEVDIKSNYDGWRRMYEKQQLPLTPIDWMQSVFKLLQQINL